MLKKLLILVVVALGVLAAVASRRPNQFSVTRTAVIQAAPAVVFSYVNDLHKWDAWSPWAKLDPNARMSYEGPLAGVGASAAWDGNREVGKGKMTITDSQPAKSVTLRLDFEKPMKSTSKSEFIFTPQGKDTQVSWTMSGDNNFVAKVIGVFMDCDKMIGGQFEKGLAQLKAVSETPVKK